MEQTKNGAVGTTQKHPGGARLSQEKKSKAPVVIIILLVALLGAYAGLCAYAASLETFYPNRHINGVEVGGLTADQAQERLQTQLLAQMVKIADAETGDVLDMVTLRDLGYTEESFAGDAAWWLGEQRRASFLEKGWAFLNTVTGRWTGGSNWRDFDETALHAAAARIAADYAEPPVHASYEVVEGAIRVTKACDGRRLDETALREALRAVHEYYDADYRVEVSFVTDPARTLTAQQLHDAVHGEMKNASYDIETGAILPETLGADFGVRSAQDLLDAAAPGETVTISARIEFPAVTAKKLEEVLFRDVLGECKTRVTGTTARRTNVRLAAEKIQGYVMNAGDVFSYNETVGKRTAEAGFQPAPAYVKGETVDEIGGGICQVSSTLYYACLRGNLAITERYAHRYVPAYIDWGMDATVSWGGPDYKFTNDTLYPIRIETVYEGGWLTVRLLGTNVDGIYAKMTNEVLSRTDWETEYVEDEAIAPGAEEVKTTPYTGYKVKSYRHVYDKDGNLLSSAFEADSNYKVRNKVILRAPGELPGQQIPVVAPVVPEIPPEVLPQEGGETAPEEAPELPAEEGDAPDIVVQEPEEDPVAEET